MTAWRASQTWGGFGLCGLDRITLSTVEPQLEVNMCWIQEKLVEEERTLWSSRAPDKKTALETTTHIERDLHPSLPNKITD